MKRRLIQWIHRRTRARWSQLEASPPLPSSMHTSQRQRRTRERLSTPENTPRQPRYPSSSGGRDEEVIGLLSVPQAVYYAQTREYPSGGGQRCASVYVPERIHQMQIDPRILDVNRSRTSNVMGESESQHSTPAQDAIEDGEVRQPAKTDEDKMCHARDRHTSRGAKGHLYIPSTPSPAVTAAQSVT